MYRPLGMLVLRGEDYSDSSDAYVTGGLPEVLVLWCMSFPIWFILAWWNDQVRRRLNLRMVEHMRKCGGGGVVVFDEVFNSSYVPFFIRLVLIRCAWWGRWVVAGPKSGAGNSWRTRRLNPSYLEPHRWLNYMLSAGAHSWTQRKGTVFHPSKCGCPRWDYSGLWYRRLDIPTDLRHRWGLFWQALPSVLFCLHTVS